MQEKVRQLGATCVFAEPQFEPKLISVITEGTAAKSATLDPEAATLEPGPDLYFKLMRAIAGSLKDCLS
jgi:zinc transport system substrate-binding protein